MHAKKRESIISLRANQVAASGLLLSVAVVNVRSHHQLKAHVVRTLCARRELASRLEACLVRQAMFGVRDSIDPRLGDRLPRFVNNLAGIGNHALDRVAWGT